MHKTFHDVFVKLCDRNNNDQLISVVADRNETDFTWGDHKVQLSQFFTRLGSNDISTVSQECLN